jgi:hypothetical protein
LILSVGLFCLPARGEIKLLGTARLEGNATDQSGLTDMLAGGIPHNRLGGISAIEYTGKEDLYLLLPDRGPEDGATEYCCRFHGLKLAVHPSQSPSVVATLVSTTMLENEAGDSIVGTISAFDRHDPLAPTCPMADVCWWSASTMILWFRNRFFCTPLRSTAKIWQISGGRASRSLC